MIIIVANNLLVHEIVCHILPVHEAQIIHGVLEKVLGLELGGAGQVIPHQQGRLRGNFVAPNERPTPAC